MDSDELKTAAELAGLEVIFRPDPIFGWTVRYNGGRMEDKDPALPAYIASLLVAKVHEKPLPQRRKMANLVDREMSGQFERAAFATDEQRIRAAVAALEKDNDSCIQR